jgi:serine/threonine protein kinase
MQGKYYGAAVDIWAFGIIMCILLTGRHPFGSDDDPNVIKRKVMNEEPEFRKEDMPKSAFDLITACLQKDPDYRPSSS